MPSPDRGLLARLDALVQLAADRHGLALLPGGRLAAAEARVAARAAGIGSPRPRPAGRPLRAYWRGLPAGGIDQALIGANAEDPAAGRLVEPVRSLGAVARRQIDTEHSVATSRGGMVDSDR